MLVTLLENPLGSALSLVSLGAALLRILNVCMVQICWACVLAGYLAASSLASLLSVYLSFADNAPTLTQKCSDRLHDVIFVSSWSPVLCAGGSSRQQLLAGDQEEAHRSCCCS